MSQESQQYNADHIQVLEGLEPVRKRPGMYIGSTGSSGLTHLIQEVVDNSVDEMQGGHATQVTVQIDLDSKWVTVQDNGRGIPTETHAQSGKSALETVLTQLHAGGKFGGEGYKVSGGLHGVGISVVNALSEELEVTVWRNGNEHVQRFTKGNVLGDMVVNKLEKKDKKKTGTLVKFLFDKQIFSKDAVYEVNSIQERLQQLAYLNPRGTFGFRVVQSTSNGNSEWQYFKHEGGISEYLADKQQDKNPIHDPIHFKRSLNNVDVEVSLQWCIDSYSETIYSFVNCIQTNDGGTHVDGLKAQLTRTLNAVANSVSSAPQMQAKKSKKSSATTAGKKVNKVQLSGEHIREGLGAVISVLVPEPEFQGQTKTKLGNPEVRKIVEQAVSEEVRMALESNPTVLKQIIQKAMEAQKAAEEARKAKDLVRRKSALTKTTLPGKLFDCQTTDLQESEIFIVEGQSAGGTVKQARDSSFQAVLPLKGKILNVQQKDVSGMLENKEVSDIVVALGLGISGDGNISQLRYGKVILLCDADADGAHIRTLLLCLLHRYKKQLFNLGHIYIGLPPLYKMEVGKKVEYCYSDNELDQLKKKQKPTAKIQIQRYKGLGEMMPQQLWDTTINPDTRKLKKISIQDEETCQSLLKDLLGKEVAPRRALIDQEGQKLGWGDLDI